MRAAGVHYDNRHRRCRVDDGTYCARRYVGRALTCNDAGKRGGNAIEDVHQNVGIRGGGGGRYTRRRVGITAHTQTWRGTGKADLYIIGGPIRDEAPGVVTVKTSI